LLCDVSYQCRGKAAPYRVANLFFLKPYFEILAFLNAFGFFGNQQKANLAFSGFFQSERLGSGKTLSELHIHYKSLLKRVYNHAECAEYWKNFIFALKVINVIDKKQMYDSVIMGKENVSKEWNCIISMFLTSFNVSFVFGYACIICICRKTTIWLFLAFFGTRSGFFW